MHKDDLTDHFGKKDIRAVFEELCKLQNLAFFGEQGEVNAHEVCGEIAERLGYAAMDLKLLSEALKSNDQGKK